MRRAALVAAFLGLIGSGLGCRAVFGRCDPPDTPHPCYQNPYPVVGPTQSGSFAGPVIAPPPVPVPVPEIPPVKDPVKEPTKPMKDPVKEPKKLSELSDLPSIELPPAR